MADSNTVPGYGTARRTSDARESEAYSGIRTTGDPTNEPGQYPPGDWGNAIFGGPLPDGTGAPGTQGAQITESGVDSTNMPGQLDDGLTGLDEQDIAETGAPGTAGAEPSTGTGADAVNFTRPGSYLSGSYASDTVRDDVSGPQDWTDANDGGYASGGPKLPGMAEPAAGTGRFQPQGGGRVLRGGRDVRP
jgi:hypothetical protein